MNNLEKVKTSTAPRAFTDRLSNSPNHLPWPFDQAMKVRTENILNFLNISTKKNIVIFTVSLSLVVSISTLLLTDDNCEEYFFT